MANIKGLKALDKEINNTMSSMPDIIIVHNSHLFDYPENNEDITRTADLEKSISEHGFTDILIVTDFGMPDGDYMIISGCRRRSAGVKKGMTQFTCKLVHFADEISLKSYNLFGNSQRAERDNPFLWENRFKRHEELVMLKKERGLFKGSVLDEVAERMGINRKQAERYRATNKLISSIKQLVIDNKGSKSSFYVIAKYDDEAQADIYKILAEALQGVERIEKSTVEMIIEAYVNGAETWADVLNKNRIVDSGLPLNSFDDVVSDDEELEGQTTFCENDEPSKNNNKGNSEKSGNKKNILTDEEKESKRGEDIIKTLEKLNTCFSDVYTFDNKTVAEEVMRNLTATFCVSVDEMYNISREYDQKELFKTLIADLEKRINDYKD